MVHMANALPTADSSIFEEIHDMVQKNCSQLENLTI
jgi:hypothetical protein